MMLHTAAEAALLEMRNTHPPTHLSRHSGDGIDMLRRAECNARRRATSREGQRFTKTTSTSAGELARGGEVPTYSIYSLHFSLGVTVGDKCSLAEPPRRT